MSLVLITPSTEALIPPLKDSGALADSFPSLSEEESKKYKSTMDLINKDIFIPIINSDDKESTIKEKVGQCRYYLDLIYAPIYNKMINWIKMPNTINNLYETFRKEVKEKVSDYDACMLIYNTLNIAEENDRYITQLLPNVEDIISLIESVGAEKYLYLFGIFQLSLSVIFKALDENPEAVSNLSLIANKYANELEPFVANFQISITPELATLREKTSEEEIENAKVLRGSILEL